MLVQALTFIEAVMFSLGFIVLLRGAALIVGDKQRAHNKRKAELVSNDYLKERVMSKVFTDKEILDFVENNLELTKDDVGEVTLVNVSCDVKFVHGDVDFVRGDVKFVHGDVKFVFGDVGSAGCDAESVLIT
tara:strand:+ start:1043 stop:1438 length:396 start_codon:yes stop_codon:yes gene_type:complete